MARATTSKATPAGAPFDAAARVGNSASRSGTVDAVAIIKFWGLKSSRDLRDLAQMGIAVRVAPGRYLLMESTRNYIQHQDRRIAELKAGKSDLSAVEEGALLRQAQRLKLELQMAEREGKLIPADDVEEAWVAAIQQSRAVVLSLPGRIRFSLPHLTVADKEEMTRIVEDALTEMAVQGLQVAGTDRTLKEQPEDLPKPAQKLRDPMHEPKKRGRK